LRLKDRTSRRGKKKENGASINKHIMGTKKATERGRGAFKKLG